MYTDILLWTNSDDQPPSQCGRRSCGFVLCIAGSRSPIYLTFSVDGYLRDRIVRKKFIRFASEIRSQLLTVRVKAFDVKRPILVSPTLGEVWFDHQIFRKANYKRYWIEWQKNADYSTVSASEREQIELSIILVFWICIDDQRKDDDRSIFPAPTHVIGIVTDAIAF